MKVKTYRRKLRKEVRAAFRDNLRVIWAKLCTLPLCERLRLAWMLLRSNSDLDGAVKKGDDQ